MLYLIYFLAFFQPQRVFVYKMQVSRINYIIDTEWRLTLMRDSKFIYKISEYNSQKKHLGIRNDTIVYTGTWHLLNDTLSLSGTDFTNKCNADIKYYKRGGKLFSLGVCVDTSAQGLRLPYLKAEKRRSKPLH